MVYTHDSKFFGKIQNAAKKKTWCKENYEYIYDGDSIWNFIGANGLTLDDAREAYKLNLIKEIDYEFLKSVWGKNVRRQQIYVIEDLLKIIERSKL